MTENTYVKEKIKELELAPPSIPVKIPEFYGQCAEDYILYCLFQTINPEILANKSLTYVDIGANHPIATNNTYLFYKRGFKGVIVEPNPYFYSMLKKVRPRDILIEGAIGTNIVPGVTKNTTLHIPDNDEIASLDSNFINNWYTANLKNGFKLQKLTSIITKAFNINDIFDNYIKNSPCILDIDVEGLDFEILQSLHINNYNIYAISIELSLPIKGQQYTTDVTNYLLEQGYILYSRTSVNHIFIKKNLLK